MAAIDTILSPADVRRFAELDPAFPLCKLSDIRQTEENEFRLCLGYDLYTAMLDAKADYTGTASWMPGMTYNEGDTVAHGGTIWEVVAEAGTASEPIAENNIWQLAPVFERDTLCGELYNDLYCRYLGRYIALKTAMMTVPRMSVHIVASGLVRRHGDNYEAAQAKDIMFMVDGLNAQAVITLDNMRHWMSLNNANGCFGKLDCDGKPVKCEITCNDACEDTAGNCATKRVKHAGYTIC